MGDIKRKKKLFQRPRKPWDAERIKEENIIVKRYGLKNKREIWKADARISKFRRQAKELIGKETGQKIFFEKLNKIGLKVKDIADVLALTKENWMERRLQTFVFKKNLAGSIKTARQSIVHKQILVDGKIVNIPGFIVTTDLENKITRKKAKAFEEKRIVKEEKVGVGA